MTYHVIYFVTYHVFYHVIRGRGLTLTQSTGESTVVDRCPTTQILLCCPICSLYQLMLACS